MRAQHHKLLPLILLAIFALLTAIEAASFAWWSSYGRGRHWCGVAQGQVYACWYAATYSATSNIRIASPTGLSAGRVESGPRWADQLPRSTSPRPAIGFASIPLWPLILATGAAAFWTHRRSLRLPGHCSKCHYDLRATPSSDGHTTCPECGTFAPRP